MNFKSEGKENTNKAISLAVKASLDKKIKYIVVASSSGDTAKLIKNEIKGNNINIICVTHANGYPVPGKNEMSDDARDELSNLGIKVLTTTHVLSGAERGISKKFGGVYPVEIIANTLRMLGQGTKVCVEISIMALDAGLIPYNEPVIVVGGSGKGADTVEIITPSHASSIFSTKVHEIVCKPTL